MSAEIDELKEQIKNLKKDRANGTLTAIGAIATPVVVAVLGGYFALTTSIKQAEIDALKLQADTEIADKDRWLEHSKFARDLMGEFFNTDSSRAKMALEIVTHADPNLGSRLTEIVSQSGPSAMQRFASAKKLELRDVLIKQLVHPDKSVRWNAAEGIQAHSDDPHLIPSLLEFGQASDDGDYQSGKWRIYNVMTVLVDLSKSPNEVTRNQRLAILKFGEWAEKADPRTKSLFAQLSVNLE